MKKPDAHTTLTFLAAAVTSGAVVTVGIQLADHVVDPAHIAVTLFAVLCLVIALAADIRSGLRIIRRHLSRKPGRPTTGAEFAKAHGNDSSKWTSADFDAELVFADLDIHRLRQLNQQPPTTKPDPQPAPAPAA